MKEGATQKIERSEIPTSRRDKANSNPFYSLVTGLLSLDYVQNEPNFLRFQPKINDYPKNEPIWGGTFKRSLRVAFAKRTQNKRISDSLDFIARFYIILAVYQQ